MSLPIENKNAGATVPTPMIRRLLNKTLLSRGQSGLVMSLRKRDRVVRKENESADYLSQHPWIDQIPGRQREIIRRFIGSLCDGGRRPEAQRLKQVLYTVGDCLGPAVIWPMLSRLLDGDTFDCEGMEIVGNRAKTQNLPPVPLEQFLEAHVPAGTRPGQLLTVSLLLKAWFRMQALVSARLNLEESKPESCSVGT